MEKKAEALKWEWRKRMVDQPRNTGHWNFLLSELFPCKVKFNYLIIDYSFV